MSLRNPNPISFGNWTSMYVCTRTQKYNTCGFTLWRRSSTHSGTDQEKEEWLPDTPLFRVWSENLKIYIFTNIVQPGKHHSTMSYLRQKSTNNVAENMIKLHIFNITYLWGTKKVPQSKCANKNRPCVSPRISNFCWNFLPGLAWKVVSTMIRQDSLSHWSQNLNWDVEK